MEDEETLAVANRISATHGLRSEFLSDARAVGVTGDFRAYTRVVNLVGSFPGHEVLAAVSTAICNETRITRVTYELSARTEAQG